MYVDSVECIVLASVRQKRTMPARSGILSKKPAPAALATLVSPHPPGKLALVSED